MRKAFTLIELLAAIGIIIVLAAVIVVVAPGFVASQRTNRGADLIQGWLFIAKNKAFRDQRPRGIRLLRDADNPNWVREMVYIERPEDLQYGKPITLPNGTVIYPDKLLVPVQNDYSRIFVLDKDLKSGDAVLPGDFFALDTLEDSPQNFHRVNSVTLISAGTPGYPSAGTEMLLAAADGTPSPVGRGLKMNVKPDGTTLFRFVRGWRPMAGEPTLQLPRDVVIDLNQKLVGTSQFYGLLSNDLDFVFGPNGQLQGNNGLNGSVILRIHDEKPTNNDQIFIVIGTRTGTISSCPVSEGIDPYEFTRDLKGGM